MLMTLLLVTLLLLMLLITELGVLQAAQQGH